jgi:hypothetical protein
LEDSIEEISDFEFLMKVHSIIWTILVVGLVFCLADVVYIICFVERHPDLLARTGSRLSPPNPLTSGKTSPPNLEQEHLANLSHEKEKVTTSNDNMKDKEPILNLLKDAGVPLDPEKDKELLEELPTWSEVTALYGNEPVIHGLDKCEQFRTHSDPADHFVVRIPRTKEFIHCVHTFLAAHKCSRLSFPIQN